MGSFRYTKRGKTREAEPLGNVYVDRDGVLSNSKTPNTAGYGVLLDGRTVFVSPVITVKFRDALTSAEIESIVGKTLNFESCLSFVPNLFTMRPSEESSESILRACCGLQQHADCEFAELEVLEFLGPR